MGTLYSVETHSVNRSRLGHSINLQLLCAKVCEIFENNKCGWK